jgi:hypothetical protein
MDQSEVETAPERKIPTLVWVILAVVLVALFALGVFLLGRPSGVMAPPPAGGPVASPVIAPAPPGQPAAGS